MAHPTILPRTNVISSKVFGMLLFVSTELMFFVAFISAFIVIKGDQTTWSIPNHIRLPVVTTAYNTLVLFASGLCFLLGARRLAKDPGFANLMLLASSTLACFFVGFQGLEWIDLISYGLTMKSSIFGALFFLLIGCHGLHALIGALAMLILSLTSKGKIASDSFFALGVFWAFVVGMWPILYGLVYF